MPEQPIIPPDQVGAKRSHRGGNNQKYFLDDRGRKYIMELYDGSKHRTDMLQRYLPGVPRRVIQRWARELGKVCPRSSWSPQQEKLLRDNFNRLSMRKLQKLIRKHSTSIKSKIAQLGLEREEKAEYYNASQLGDALGIKHDKVISWIKKGWLRATKRDTAFNHDVWQISLSAIRTFIFEHPNQLDPHRFDWLWVVDVLAGDIGMGELGPQRKGESV
jgi:hypothetical protein